MSEKLPKLPDPITGDARPRAGAYLYRLVIEGWEGSWDYPLSHDNNYTAEEFQKLVIETTPRAIAYIRDAENLDADDPNGRGDYILTWAQLAPYVARLLVWDYGFHGHGITKDIVSFGLEDEYPIIDESIGHAFDPAKGFTVIDTHTGAKVLP